MRRDPAIVLLALGQTLAWASIYYLFPALLLRWEQTLGWSKTELTAAIAMAVLISAALSPLTGRIIDRGHGASLVLGSAIVGGIGLALLSFVSELWQFHAVWMVIGAAMAGCLYEPIFALVTRARGDRARQAIILITLVAGFASTISYPAIYSLAEAAGWRGAVRIASAVMILLVAPVHWVGVRRLDSEGAAGRVAKVASEPTRAFLQNPAFWFLAAGFACLAITHGATLHHLLPILDERGLSAEMAVLAASFIGPMQVAGRLAMMASERYLSNNGVAIAAFGLLGLSVVLLMFSGSSPAFLSASVILFGGAYGTVSILRPLLAREILGETNFGAKSGALAMPYLAGSAISPFLGSILWSIGGYDFMLILLTVCIALGGVLYAFAYRLAKRS